MRMDDTQWLWTVKVPKLVLQLALVVGLIWIIRKQKISIIKSIKDAFSSSSSMPRSSRFGIIISVLVLVPTLVLFSTVSVMALRYMNQIKSSEELTRTECPRVYKGAPLGASNLYDGPLSEKVILAPIERGSKNVWDGLSDPAYQTRGLYLACEYYGDVFSLLLVELPPSVTVCEQNQEEEGGPHPAISCY